MNPPVTTLDQRYSAPDTVAVGWDETICFCTGAAEQKAVNLSGNPHVILTTVCDRWDEGLDVVVEGAAVQVTHDDALKRLARAWTRKWDGRWQYQVRDGCFRHPGGEEPIPVFSVTPTQILAFTRGAAGGHTSHKF